MNRFKNNSQFWMQAGKLILVAIAYWVAVRLGLLLVAQPEGVASIWPASGLALAVLLLNPKREWTKLLAVIFITNATGNLSGGNSILVSLGFALANTLEALLGAWALIYFCKSKITFERTLEVFVLFGVAIISNGFTALLGAAVSTLAFGAPFFNTWLVWWTSDGLGMILVAPFIVTLFTGQPILRSASLRRRAEAVALIFVLTAFAWLLFGPFTVAEEPVLRNYMLFPLLIWLAFRYSPRGMSSALMLLAVIAIWNTLRGYGIFAFADQDVTEHLVSLQMLLTVAAFSGLFLSAMLTELKQSGQSLRESQALLFNAFNNSPLLMTISDLSTGKYLEVNDSFCTVSGFSREEAIGRTSIELGWISAEERTRMVSELQQHGNISGLELALRCKSGKTITCKFMGTIIQTEQGSKLFSTAEDITARKQTDEKLRESEQKYQAVVENANDGILVAQDGVMKFVNSRIATMFGYAVNEVQGREFQLLLPPENLDLIERYQNRLAGIPVPAIYETMLLHKNRARIPVEINANIIQFEGKPADLVIMRDITARKQADEKLKESEERFTTIFRANPAAVAITRLSNSQFVDVNEAWQNLTGYTLAEVVGHTPQELNLWASPEQRERLIGMLGEHGKARGEMQLRIKSGDIRNLLMSAELIELRNERYLLTMAQDITELKQTEEQLKETLSLLRIAEESAKLGGWSVDLEKNRCTWSDQVAAIHEAPAGFSPLVEEGINFYAPEWREKIAKVFGDCAQNGIPYDEEMEIITVNGKRVWVQTMGEAIRDEAGKIYKVQGAFQDISKRKQDEDIIQKRNQMLLALHNVAMEIGNELQLPILLESILQHAQSMLDADRGGGIYLYDAGENVMRLAQGSGINHGRKGITVRVDNGVVGNVFRTLQPLVIDDYTHWEGRADVLVADPPSTVMGVPLFSNNQIIGVLTLIANSQLRKFNEQDVQQAEMFAAQASIGIRNAQYFQQAQQEISERKQAEEALRESSERLAHMITNSPTAIYALKIKGDQAILTWISGNIEPILGFSEEEAMRPDWWLEQVHSQDRPQAIASLEHLYDDFYQHEYRFLRKDGSLVWLRDEHRLLRDAENKPLEIIGAWTDITEHKQVEEKIRQLNAELEQRVQERTCELREAQEKLVRQEKLAVLGQMASSVGHELRNPLSVITSAIYYLKMVQPDADAKIKEYLGIIDQEVHNSDKIITDLLDFARVKSVDREVVSVSDLVHQTLERFPAPANVEVTLDIPTDLPRAYVDVRQMIQVLGNLTVNACQAMKDGGQLSVNSEQLSVNNEQWIRIAVKDTGTGISPENMKKLFEPLFTTKTKGIGLGLAVSQKLTEANGGRIEVESEAGVGSTFTVWLPTH